MYIMWHDRSLPSMIRWYSLCLPTKTWPDYTELDG